MPSDSAASNSAMRTDATSPPSLTLRDYVRPHHEDRVITRWRRAAATSIVSPMKEFHGSVTVEVAAYADDLFALITDIDRLPQWNDAIDSIVEWAGVIEPGAEWVVVMHVPKLPRWRSRSRAEIVDADSRRFVYRSQTDDSNPSYAQWTWELEPTAAGTRISVTWEGHPKTIGRKLLGAPIRRPQLEREVVASLDALAHLATAEVPQ